MFLFFSMRQPVAEKTALSTSLFWLHDTLSLRVFHGLNESQKKRLLQRLSPGPSLFFFSFIFGHMSQIVFFAFSVCPSASLSDHSLTEKKKEKKDRHHLERAQRRGEEGENSARRGKSATSIKEACAHFSVFFTPYALLRSVPLSLHG